MLQMNFKVTVYSGLKHTFPLLCLDCQLHITTAKRVKQTSE